MIRWRFGFGKSLRRNGPPKSAATPPEYSTGYTQSRTGLVMDFVEEWTGIWFSKSPNADLMSGTTHLIRVQSWVVVFTTGPAGEVLEL